jgi:hypothetical protein
MATMENTEIRRYSKAPQVHSMQIRGAKLVEIYAQVAAEELGLVLDGVWWNAGLPFWKDGPNKLSARLGPHCVAEHFSASRLENVGCEGFAAEALGTVREMMTRLVVLDRVEGNVANLRISPDPRQRTTQRTNWVYVN